MFKRGSVYWTCIRHNGRKVQRSLGTADRKLAKMVEALVKAQIVEEKYFEKLPGEKKTVADMMERFVKEHAPKVSQKMQISYRTSLKHLLPFFGNQTLVKVLPRHISEYKQKRLSIGRKPATVNREIACLSKAFSIAVKEWEWVKENPVSRVPREKEENILDRWLSKDEEITLLKQSPDWLKDVILFALNTGMRQGELINLEWPEVDIFKNTVVALETKNREPRTIPLNREAFEVLKQRSRLRNMKVANVFLSENGFKIDPSKIRKVFRALVKKTGIRNFRFHDLRHTFGSRLAQAGVDLFHISRLMGHRDIGTTMRYLHHSSESLRNVVTKLDSDYNLTTVGGRPFSK